MSSPTGATGISALKKQLVAGVHVQFSAVGTSFNAQALKL